MSSIEKASAFPETVQSGIPRLGKRPTGWIRSSLSEHLYEERRPIVLKDNKKYDLVTVRRARGGVVKRETKLGRDIAVKTQFLVQAGDFLISKRQIVHGACGVVPPELDGSIVSNEYAVLRSHKTLSLDYLKYLSHSIYFQQTCFHSSIGVHVEKMIFKLEKWFEWKFDLPPIAEQKQIVKILSTWDAAIEITKRLAAASEVQKGALMQQLFTGDRRLGTGKKAFRSTTLGAVAFIDRLSLRADTPPNYEFDYISLSDVTAGSISKNLQRVRFRNAPSRARRIVRRSDILMATVRPNLRGFAMVKSGRANYVASTGFAVLTAKKGVCPAYLYHYLFSPHIAAQIDALCVGSSYPAINSSDVAHLAILAPPENEQKLIASVLDDSAMTIRILHQQIDRLVDERSALMQHLFARNLRARKVKVAA